MAGIYIHIPFCKKACHYCDFHFSTNTSKKKEMLDAIKNELEDREESLHKQEIDTIYFGGGTPSLLSDDEIFDLLDHIKNGYKLSEKIEITLEANPDDLTKKRLIDLRSTPINRLSIGVQSLDNTILQWMNRAHNAEQATACIDDALAVGFTNLSVDLIYGIPNQSNETFTNDLLAMMTRNINHISCYALTVEPDTALSKMIQQNKSENVSDDLMISHFEILTKIAKEQGFEHYEISNFARNGAFSKHNTSYWEGKSYIGVGPSAHSFDGSIRRWNVSNNATYMDKITKEEVYYTEETLTPPQQLNELIMTRLRTMWGLQRSILEKAEPSFGFLVDHYTEAGLLESVNKNIRLTNAGKLLSDKIIGDFFV
jgi:oxygen-independent coproporphyrinogen-3 oxidase